MPRRRHRECDGKTKHASEEAAKRAKRTLTVNRFAPPDTMRTYECGTCGAWHVGHRPGVNGGRGPRRR